jgi:hypothetical protein
LRADVTVADYDFRKNFSVVSFRSPWSDILDESILIGCTARLMAKQRPTGKCKLCGEERLLCDSHYLPKGLYKTAGAGATGLKNPNPVMNINGVLKQISDQYRGYVLCESCENLFTKQSESWVLANLPKQYGDPCALQDALAPLTPTSGGQRWERYNVSQVQEFDIPKLVYFGMSIFWRSVAHDWKTSAGQKAPLVDLGAYEEPIRKFLLGNAPFPDDVVLAIDIWPYKDVLPLLHPVVTEQLPQGVRRYWFYVPGLQCFLFTGANIPKDARESAATAGFVTLDLDAADSLKEFVKQGIKAQSFGPKIDAMFKEIASIRASKK